MVVVSGEGENAGGEGGTGDGSDDEDAAVDADTGDAMAAWLSNSVTDSEECTGEKDGSGSA